MSKHVMSSIVMRQAEDELNVLAQALSIPSRVLLSNSVIPQVIVKVLMVRDLVLIFGNQTVSNNNKKKSHCSFFDKYFRNRKMFPVFNAA
jgi:hypothetical protein